jgi:hypothetical protein
MNDRDKRKSRMQELLKNVKEKKVQEIDVNLMDCIDALQPNVEILSPADTKQAYDDLQITFPFVWWGRIDWDNVEDKIQVTKPEEIINYLNNRFKTDDYIVYALWGYSSGNSPVIKINLKNAISHIDDVNAVGGDQWLYCSSYRFAIEFYHDGDIIIGFGS